MKKREKAENRSRGSLLNAGIESDEEAWDRVTSAQGQRDAVHVKTIHRVDMHALVPRLTMTGRAAASSNSTLGRGGLIRNQEEDHAVGHVS